MPRVTYRFATFWPIVNGCAIHTRISVEPRGVQNSPLLLVHGLGVSAQYMLPSAERLANYFRVFVPELPGFGDSGKPNRVLTVPELADQLVDWLPQVGLARAIFLGNSLGCQIVVDLAVRYPQCMEAAVLVSPTIDPRDRTIFGQLWRGFRDLWREPWALWPILVHDYLRTGTRRMYQTLRYALDDPIEHKLPKMQIPTLIVRGDRDTIVPQAWAEEVTTLLPMGRLVVIPQGTHASNFSAPEQLTQAVLEFVRSLSHAP